MLSRQVAKFGTEVVEYVYNCIQRCSCSGRCECCWTWPVKSAVIIVSGLRVFVQSIVFGEAYGAERVVGTRSVIRMVCGNPRCCRLKHMSLRADQRKIERRRSKGLPDTPRNTPVRQRLQWVLGRLLREE